MIKLDGSHGEGGGQIVRTALALSTLLQKPFEVDNIRTGRKQPGLKAQHLTCINALKDICGAEAEGAEKGSTYLKYSPHSIKPGRYDIDIGTAGSITLLLQSLLVPFIFAQKKMVLNIKGGTSGKWQMPYDYFTNVLVPHLKKYAEIESRLIKRGYYPKGGGEIELAITPKYTLESRKEAPAIDLMEQGNLLSVRGVSHASKSLQDREVAERQTKAAEVGLSRLKCPVNIRTEYADTLSTGSGITIWASYSLDNETSDVNPIVIGSDALGERGKRAEDVGADAAAALLKEIGHKAPVDSHLADNLLPFLALFGKRMKVSGLSKHTMTNTYTIEQFLGKTFRVDKSKKIIEAGQLNNKKN